MYEKGKIKLEIIFMIKLNYIKWMFFIFCNYLLLKMSFNIWKILIIFILT